MVKWDGHTHTEYCPHGAVQDVEELIQKAITLGFKRYSVTEHAPLPPAIYEIAGGPVEIWTTAAMAQNDLDHYFNKMEKLQKKYASDLELKIGFELDYFTAEHAWTTDFLNEYGPRITDSLLSVHFLPGTGGLRGIDFSTDDYKTGIVEQAGTFQNAQILYYRTVLESLEADLGPYKPSRLGHISLCQKFQKAFAEEETGFAEESLALIDEILHKTKEKNYTLDLNTAGLFKTDCQETYPPTWLIRAAQQLQIPFIYGSDSHSLTDVGRGYEKIQNYV